MAPNRAFSELRFIVALFVTILIASPAFVVYPLAFSSSRFLAIGGSRFSFQWFTEALTSKWISGLITSTVLALATSFTAVAIGAPAAFYRLKVGFSIPVALIESGAVVLLLVPPISLAVGYFRAYGEASVFPLFLGHVALAFPYAYFSLLAGFRSIGPQVIDAAELLGSGNWATLARVLMPAARRSLVLGLTLAFLISWDESVLSVFNTLPGVSTLPKLTWESMQRDRDLTAAAVNAVLGPILLVLLLKLVRVEYVRRPL